MKQERLKPTFYVIIAVVIFFAVNMIGYLSLNKYDIDLTEDQIFTLSDGTKKILNELDEPITLRFFFSNKEAGGYPMVKSYAARISGLLEEYVGASNGNVSYQLIDPEPFSDDEDLAVSYGLKGVPVDQEGGKVYLGLAATNSVDEVRSIPIFAFEREAFLEYELTRIIADLSNAKKPVIGLLSSRKMTAPNMLGIPGMRSGDGWIVTDQIVEVFDVIEIDEGETALPENIDVLMVVQPKEVNDDMLYAIDQYLLKGGHALLFIDPNAEGENGFSPDNASYDPRFSKILRQWGVKIATDRVVVDRKAGRRVNSNASEKGYVDYIAWLELQAHNIEKKDIITSTLSALNMASVGAIESLDSEGIEFLPLIHSSQQSMLMPTSAISGAPKPNDLLRQFVSDNREYVIAARVSGLAKTAFPGKSGSGHIAESESPANLVVVADSDMLRDQFWVRTQKFDGYRIAMPMAENGPFVVNALDHLAGSSDLISLRSRGTATRPFDVVDELKREAEERYLEKEELLKARLEETESKIASLQEQSQQQSGGVRLFQQEQREAIQRFSQEAVEVRKELRSVQRELRKGIESLGTVLKFINIILGPLIIIAVALFVLVYRVRKQTAARQKAKS